MRGLVHTAREVRRSHRWKVRHLIWFDRKKTDKIRLTGRDQARQTNDSKTFHRKKSMMETLCQNREGENRSFPLI